jgi:transcriptional regulator with XRE-family HTH domain
MSAAELARRSSMPSSSISSIENGRYLPRLRTLRQLCRTLGVGGDLLLELVKRFYADRYERSGYRDEEELFRRYMVTRVGSPEEEEIRNEILERFAWIPNALARRESRDLRDDAVQVAWVGMLSAINNHVPSASFAAHAWASGRGAIFRLRLARRFPDLDNRTRKIVSTVEAQIHRMATAGEGLDNTEIARATRLKVADIALAREILDRPILRLDAPVHGHDGSWRREMADQAPVGFSDTDFAMTVRAALSDMPDPAIAERLVMLHLVEGMPLTRIAERLGLPVASAMDVLADSVVRLRAAFDQREPGATTASEPSPPPLTPWNRSSEEIDQPSASNSDSETGEGNRGPGGFIGNRPHDPAENPSEPSSHDTTSAMTPWSRLPRR